MRAIPKQENLKRNLNNLLLNDILIDIYNEQNDIIIFSFCHLSSVYNGLIWYNIKEKTYNINFQYHDYTKKLEKLLIKFLESIKINNLQFVFQEVEYFKTLAKKIFDCKYSLDIYLHIINN